MDRALPESPLARVCRRYLTTRLNEVASSLLVRPIVAFLHLKKATVIVALDADMPSAGPTGWSSTRARLLRDTRPRIGEDEQTVHDRKWPLHHWSSRRPPPSTSLGANSSSCRIFSTRSSPKRLRPLPRTGQAQPEPSAEILKNAHVLKFLNVITKDLLTHRGASLLVAGPNQPAKSTPYCTAINSLLSNVGRTVQYIARETASASPSATPTRTGRTRQSRAGR